MAFVELSESRNIGMTIGAIPWHIINEYAKAYQFDEEQTEALHHHLKAMDACYIAYCRRKN